MKWTILLKKVVGSGVTSYSASFMKDQNLSLIRCGVEVLSYINSEDYILAEKSLHRDWGYL